MTRSKDVKCPYCREWQEICRDDGAGCNEGVIDFQQCSDCGVTFSYTTEISFDYESRACGCATHGPHYMRMTETYPKKYIRWECRDCGYEQDLTDEQMTALLAEDAGVSVIRVEETQS